MAPCHDPLAACSCLLYFDCSAVLAQLSVYLCCQPDEMLQGGESPEHFSHLPVQLGSCRRRVTEGTAEVWECAGRGGEVRELEQCAARAAS